jgi:hypothetical protein
LGVSIDVDSMLSGNINFDTTIRQQAIDLCLFLAALQIILVINYVSYFACDK